MDGTARLPQPTSSWWRRRQRQRGLRVWRVIAAGPLNLPPRATSVLFADGDPRPQPLPTNEPHRENARAKH